MTEKEEALDHFLQGSQEIQLTHSFPPRSKTKHASFGTDDRL
jgi:hypothetical protein